MKLCLFNSLLKIAAFLMTKISFHFSTTSAEKIKTDKDVAAPLKELGLRVSKFLVSEAALGLFFIPGMNCYWILILKQPLLCWVERN